MQDEGYVKYQCFHQKADWHTNGLKINEKTLQEFNELDILRTELFDVHFIGQYPNGLGYGNVSLRCPINENQNSLIISATATGGARELGLDGYCLVTKADIKNNLVYCLGPLAASSETLTHVAIYQNTPEVNFVVHIHHKKLFEVLLNQQNILKTPKNIEYGSVEMANSLGKIAKAYPMEGCVLMEGHEEGIIFYGTSLIQVQSQISFVAMLLE